MAAVFTDAGQPKCLKAGNQLSELEWPAGAHGHHVAEVVQINWNSLKKDEFLAMRIWCLFNLFAVCRQ